MNNYRIFIIKIGAIGDVITALPVLNELVAKYPDKEITWVCGKVVSPILKKIPTINYVVEVNEEKIFSRNPIKVISELIKYYSNFLFKKYDLVLNYHVDFRYNILSLFLIKNNFLKFDRNSLRPSLIPGRHRSYEHIRLFLQIDCQDNRICTFPKFCSIILNEELLQKIPANPIIICPGGAKNLLNEQGLRRWPIQNYVDLSEKLILKGYNIILIGANTDQWVINYFAEVNVLNLVGKLNLLQLISLFKLSSIVITHDSGPFHLAIFSQNPHVIGLFGPTSPREFTYGNNFGDKIKTIWGGESLSCSPCYYGKLFSKNCSDNICMKRITVDEVYNSIVEWKKN